MWNEITTEKDLNSFMDVMCYFHDSCLKEIKYISGAYVNEKLSMIPVNDKRILKRQFENPSVGAYVNEKLSMIRNHSTTV